MAASRHSSPHRRSPIRGRSRTIELIRAAWEAALLFGPRRVMTNVNHLKVDSKSVVIARVLGARHLTQAVLSGFWPSAEVLAMGVWVDAVHSSTAFALALIDRSRARAGLTDAAVAGFWAATGYRDLARGAATPPSHQRRRDRLARLALGVAPGGRLLRRQVSADRRR
jgi:hypothetical protein